MFDHKDGVSRRQAAREYSKLKHQMLTPYQGFWLQILIELFKI